METDRNRRDDSQPRDNSLPEKLVQLNRTAKVVKGGHRFSFRPLTAVGDHQGQRARSGKANDVTEAIRKSAVEKARKAVIQVPIKNGIAPA